MLTPADRDLAARDTAVPGFRTVLDADALLDRFAGMWPRGVPAPRRARIVYLRYKPATSLLAGLVVETPAGTRCAFAKAYGPGGEPKLAKLRTAAADDAGWGALVDDELRLALVDSTSDRRLPGLRELVGYAPEPVEPLRYKPERRWVGVTGRGTGAARLVKVHRPATAHRCADAYRTVASAGLPVPALHLARRDVGLLAYEWFPGVSLADRGPSAAELATTGRLLADLHAVPPPGATHDHVRGLAEAVDTLSVLQPRCATVAQSAAFAAAGALGGGDARVTVHGDFSADQVIAGDTGLGLVDLDAVHADDPAADLASWAAAEIVAGRAPADAEPAEVLGPLLDAYLTATGSRPPDRLDALTAVALLRRAPEPFRLRLPDWPARVMELVHAADRLAQRVCTR